MTRRGPALLLALPATVLLVVFFAWPMLSIVTEAVVSEPGAIGRVLGDAGLRSVAWFTLWQATVSTVLALAIGMPLAGVLARYRFPLRGAIRTLVTIPFVLPTVVVAAAFLSLIGPRGALGVDLAGTVWAILAAHVFFNLAVVVRTVGGLWAHLDPSTQDAAATLGATPWKVFRTVTFPLLRPAIGAAAAIVFLFSFTSFGVVLLLGAPRLATIEVEIYRTAALLFDLPTAGVLALLQMAAVAAALLVYTRFQDKMTISQRLVPATAGATRLGRADSWRITAWMAPGLALVIAPLATIAWKAFTPGGALSLAGFTALGDIDPAFVDIGAAIRNSLAYGTATGLLAIGTALPLAVMLVSHREHRWLDALVMLPLGSSAVALGFGLVIALDSPLDLRTWWLLVPIAHALIAGPLVLRTITPVLRSISPRIREAARTLGAAPARVVRTIDLPIVAPAAAAATALAFIVSLGEFGATLFVARPGGQTITIAIFRLLGRPGATNRAAALALSVVLIGITSAVVVLIERLRPGAGTF